MEKTVEELAKVFYPFYLKKEIQKRENAIDALKTGNFDGLRNFNELKKYGHYYNVRGKEHILTSTLVPEAIKEMQKIVEELPDNASVPIINTYVERDDGFSCDDETSICIEWKEYFIDEPDKCNRLAKTWARHAAWKMKNQPNGLDGKRSQELYNKLIKGK